MPTDYPYGATLEIRGERWILSRHQTFGACRLLTLGGADRANATHTLRVIEPFDRPRCVSGRKLRRRPRRAVLRAALAALAAARGSMGLWSAAAASITVLPYQLEPALAVIGGATRLLLADAVGLGKTIQAGLILAELRARGWIDRALIVCPSGLRDTWAAALKEHFGLDAAIVDRAAIAGRMATLPPGINPWSSDDIVIVSIDLLKRPEVLTAVDRVPIDLLIVDEAHHLTPGTDRGAAISRLARRVPWVTLLSATPHSGDASAFSYLTAIGHHGDGLSVFRRTRLDAGTAGSRRTRLLAVRPSENERAVMAAVDRYVRAIWHGRGATDRSVRLVAITMARRAASSLEALTHTVTRRLALLSGDVIREPEQTLLPWDESDGADAVEDDAVLAVSGLDDAAAERQCLEQLLALTRACERGSKIDRLLRLLRRIHEPAVVFTEYRDTLQAIASRIDPSRCCVIHGGMTADLRREGIARFTAAKSQILLATDAAGEGLNLHHSCRLVIDMELPWNPLRLEQRVGRVDRIGQRRTVHALRLFHPGTIEERVLDQLRIRSHCADQAMERCANEHEIADAVFDGRALPSLEPLPRRQVTAAAIDEAARIERQRAVRAQCGSPATPCWTASRSGPLLLLYRTTFYSRTQWPIFEQFTAQLVDLARTPVNRREWRHLVEGLSQQGLTCASSDVRPGREALTARIAAIRSMLAHRSHVEYQRSLFDRRADAAALERDKTLAQLDEALDRALRAATCGGDGGSRTELIAAWPGSPR